MFNVHVTAARHGLVLIDLYALRRELLPGGGELFSPDGLHPSAAGYQAWAERMLPLVKPLLREEAHP
jgi:lysophospholipase L1-like esterase